MILPTNIVVPSKLSNRISMLLAILLMSLLDPTILIVELAVLVEVTTVSSNLLPAQISDNGADPPSVRLVIEPISISKVTSFDEELTAFKNTFFSVLPDIWMSEFSAAVIESELAFWKPPFSMEVTEPTDFMSTDLALTALLTLMSLLGKALRFSNSNLPLAV